MALAHQEVLVNVKQVRLTLMVCFTLVSASVLSGRQPPTEDTQPVQMVVTAEPHKGAEVPVVKAADVTVNEGKERDQVAAWIPAQGDRAALEFFVLIDDSSRDVLATQFQDIKKFIAEQPPTTKIGIAYMQNGIARIEQNLTNDHDQAIKAIRLPLGYSGANASPYFSLSDLVKKWPRDAARHEVLMITNGFDPYYGATADMLDPYLDAAIEDSQRAGVIVSAIYEPSVGHVGHSYWLTYWSQMYLAKLAEETGGEAYYIDFTGQAPDFTPYLKDISNRLNHQYILGFVPESQKKGGMRSVKLKTELHNVDLVGANRVYVPTTSQ
jgi:hypothetical protein